MERSAAVFAAFLAVSATSSPLFAQEPVRDPDPSAGTSAALARFQTDPGGGLHVSKHFAVVFGGIKQGSGAAAGPAISREWESGAFAQLKAVFSIRAFKLVQARYDSRPFWRKRLTMSTRVRWQDAPRLSLYRLGVDSSDARAEYSERRSEWSGVVKTRLPRNAVVTGGLGLERYASSGGWIDTHEDETLDVVPQTPGLGTRPWFVHSFAEIAHDTRLSPDYSRTGHFLEAAVHAYADAHDGEQSFQRVTLAAYQLIPTFSARGAIGVGARTWLSMTGDGRQVPFFLMPTLGGGNYLRGYSSYRFRDRNALLLQAEYRWAVHKMVDVAGLYEAGSVSATAGGLSVRNMAQSAGGGIRVHTKTSGVFRADLARGRDGLKLAFGVGLGGA